MSTNRREFLGQLTAGAMLGALPLSAFAPSELLALGSAPAEDFDLSWVNKLKGKKHKVVADCVFPESGYGVWRAHMWGDQYQTVLKVPKADTQTVLVIRHDAVVLGLKQEMWDRYEIGKEAKVTHPITQQGTMRNPALMGASDGVPDVMATWNLPSLMANGGIVLACNVALHFWSMNIAKKDGVSEEEAYKRAVAGLQPGVLLQPSGVFAVVKAQEEGCTYLRASA